MSAPPLLLSTLASPSSDAVVVVWDPIAGNPIANFSGDPPTKSTLTTYGKSIVLCSVAGKPILQMWSFQSMGAFKRMTTKGIVNALSFTADGSLMCLAIEKSVYVYQTCSGCMLGVFEAGHLAPIGQLVVSRSATAPLLLSVDVYGTLACWRLDCLGDSLHDLGHQPATILLNGASNEQASRHRPLWFVVQASRVLPTCDFLDKSMVVVAGTDGLKFYDALTGKLLHTLLSDSHPLLSLCCLPSDNYLFMGTDNGILHTVWIKDIKNFKSYELSFRRCFADVELTAVQKAIIHATVSPESGLLAVAVRCGLVEVLRLDAGLTRLQRFNLAVPGSSTIASIDSPGTSSMVTGLRFVQRPRWLADQGASISTSEDHAVESEDSTATEKFDAFSNIRPLKRQIGWLSDDLCFLRLPNLKQDRLHNPFWESIFKDDFYKKSTVDDQAPFAQSLLVDEGGAISNSLELERLREKCHNLEEKNRQLLSTLVSNSLHY